MAKEKPPSFKYFPQITREVHAELMVFQAFSQIFPVQTLLIFGKWLSGTVLHSYCEPSPSHLQSGDLCSNPPPQKKIYVPGMVSLIKALNAVILSDQTFFTMACEGKKKSIP